MPWYMTPFGPQYVIEPGTIDEFERRDYVSLTTQQAADYFAGVAFPDPPSFATEAEVPGIMATVAANPTSAFSVQQRAALVASEARAESPTLPKRISEQARSTPVDRSALVDAARRSKGGRLGTGGKSAVAFRFDHQLTALRDTIWPIFRSRAIPGSLHLTTNWAADEPESAGVTWADVKTMNRDGLELWAHTYSHKDPEYYPGVRGVDPPLTGDALYAALKREIVDIKATIEAQGIKVMGGGMAGVPTATLPGYSSNYMPNFNSVPGRMLLENYPLIELNEGSQRALPTDGCVGLGHVTLDQLTLAQAKAFVDVAVNYPGRGIEFLVHPAWITGTGGYMSVADLTAFADYVVAKRDAGLIDVLSPSGLAFADPERTKRLELLRDGGFDQAAGATWSVPAGMTINTDGGHTGSNYLHVLATTGTRAAQTNTYILSMQVGGELFMFEGWARAPGGIVAARAWVKDNQDATRLDKEMWWDMTAGQAWTKFMFPFSVPVATQQLRVEVGRRTGDMIDWDDVRVYKV